MSGMVVTIPADPQRVAIIDKGLVVQSMIALGVDDRIVATGGVINPKSANPTKNRDTLYLQAEPSQPHELRICLVWRVEF